MADWLRKMASNQKMQENKPTLKFNFTIEKRWPVSKFSFWHSHWALIASVGKGGKGSADWNYCPPSESVALLSFIMNLNSLSWKCIKVALTNSKKRWCAFVKTVCFFRSVCKDGMHTRSRFISGLPTAFCGWNEIGQISLMAAPQNFSAQKGTLPLNAHRWKQKKHGICNISFKNM